MAYKSNDPGFDALMRRIASFEMLTPEEEGQLAWRVFHHEDPHAREKIANAHLRLVGKFARVFSHQYKLSAADLFGEGSKGLMEATFRFNPDRGVRFATYATWWIRSAVQDYILRNWSIVRGGTSSSQKKLFFQHRYIRRQIAQLDGTLSETELDEQVAAKIGVSVGDVVTMRQRHPGDVSLNQPLTDDEGDEAERIDFLIDPNEDHGVRLANEEEVRLRSRALHAALGTLKSREEYILRARNMHDPDAEPKTLEDLSEIFGISRERVRQIEKRAKGKVAAHIRGRLTPSRTAAAGS